MSKRREARCEVCGEVKEVATKSECYACYRARQREQSNPQMIDRHNPGLRREHQKLVSGFHKVMSGLIDLRSSRQDVLKIRAAIGPYVEPVEWALVGESARLREHDREVHVHQKPHEPIGEEPGDEWSAHA